MPVDDSGFMAGMDDLLARVNAAGPVALGKVGLRIVAGAMGNAPVLTGTLRRSIHLEGPVGGGGYATAKVGPATVYARRIELGFMDMTDSLGRLFHQAPHPYFDPAVESVLPIAGELIESTLAAAIGG